MSAIEADLCIIGAGAGGLSVAAGAAQLGARTVLIEKGRMGGECLNTGCVPSKALLAAAKRGADFAGAMRQVQDAIAAIAPKDSAERFERLGATVIRAAARFIGRRDVAAGDITVRARRFVVATGSRPVIPPIPGLAETDFLTNETLFDNRVLPRHLAIIGGGATGIEMAQAHRRLGADVTVIEAARMLAGSDRELVELLLDRLRAEGIALIEGAEIREVAAERAGVVLHLADGRRIEASHLLLAAGRRPALDGLDLDRAGVAVAAGRLVLDARLRTTNRRIYAVGDAAGAAQLSSLAAYHAGIVIRNALFRLPACVNPGALPGVLYTAPELAQLGLTEAAARAMPGLRFEVLRHDLAENDRALIEQAAFGRIKLIAGRGGRILGIGILGPAAGELIQPWALAMSRGLRLSAMAQMIAPYPTFGEASRQVAASYYAPRLFGPVPRGLVRLLRMLG